MHSNLLAVLDLLHIIEFVNYHFHELSKNAYYAPEVLAHIWKRRDRRVGV